MLAPKMIVLQHVKAGQMETLGTRLKGACNMLRGSRPNGNETRDSKELGHNHLGKAALLGALPEFPTSVLQVYLGIITTQKPVMTVQRKHNNLPDFKWCRSPSKAAFKMIVAKLLEVTKSYHFRLAYSDASFYMLL